MKVRDEHPSKCYFCGKRPSDPFVPKRVRVKVGPTFWFVQADDYTIGEGRVSPDIRFKDLPDEFEVERCKVCETLDKIETWLPAAIFSSSVIIFGMIGWNLGDKSESDAFTIRVNTESGALGATMGLAFGGVAGFLLTLVVGLTTALVYPTKALEAHPQVRSILESLTQKKPAC